MTGTEGQVRKERKNHRHRWLYWFETGKSSCECEAWLNESTGEIREPSPFRNVIMGTSPGVIRWNIRNGKFFNSAFEEADAQERAGEKAE
jgi:hypothetical protein